MRAIVESEWFQADLDFQFKWYCQETGYEVAELFDDAVSETLLLLSTQPGVGTFSRFHHPQLADLRYCLVRRPFERILVFYRHDDLTLYAVRLIHGMRDLPRRLQDAPRPS